MLALRSVRAWVSRMCNDLQWVAEAIAQPMESYRCLERARCPASGLTGRRKGSRADVRIVYSVEDAVRWPGSQGDGLHGHWV